MDATCVRRNLLSRSVVFLLIVLCAVANASQVKPAAATIVEPADGVYVAAADYGF